MDSCTHAAVDVFTKASKRYSSLLVVLLLTLQLNHVIDEYFWFDPVLLRLKPNNENLSVQIHECI